MRPIYPVILVVSVVVVVVVVVVAAAAMFKLLRLVETCTLSLKRMSSSLKFELFDMPAVNI